MNLTKVGNQPSIFNHNKRADGDESNQNVPRMNAKSVTNLKLPRGGDETTQYKKSASGND